MAFIADGVNPDNPDFIRANGQHVFVDYQDFSGTGTDAPTDGGEAFLDSSSIAAQGREVYNVAGYGAGLSTPCRIRILGVAPGASLVGLNVFGSANVAYNSVFLEAINYAVNHDHVNVINESFGDNPFPDTSSLDLTKHGRRRRGQGRRDRHRLHRRRRADQHHRLPRDRPERHLGRRVDHLPRLRPDRDRRHHRSRREGLDRQQHQRAELGRLRPERLDRRRGRAGRPQLGPVHRRPGEVRRLHQLRRPAPPRSSCSGGTSEAAPLTAGVAALVIQAYRKAHNGATPSPAVVKQIIVSTAQNINAPADQQGAGLIDAYQAVLAAASYHVEQAATGHAILASATQLNAVGQPGTTEHFDRDADQRRGRERDRRPVQPDPLAPTSRSRPSPCR